MRSTLSILGLWQIRNDIFDNMQLPDGLTMSVLMPELLAQTAELESLYTDPDILKTLIGAWSARRLYTWTQLYDTTQLEYNPIWNKDGVVTETETRSLDSDRLETRDLKNTADSTSTSDSLHSVYGFNSTSAQAESEDHSEAAAESTATDTGTVKDAKDETETITRSRVEQGNIGVTTTQSMIKEQRDIVNFDIYQFIIDDFRGRFCLLVY